MAKFESVMDKLEYSTAPFNPDSLPWEKLPQTLNPTAGNLDDNRALRKRHQIANLFHIARRLVKDGDTIVDFWYELVVRAGKFGSVAVLADAKTFFMFPSGGGGHLSLVLAYLFPKVNVVLLDKNHVSLGWARKRLADLKLSSQPFNPLLSRNNSYIFNLSLIQLILQ